VRPLYWSLTFPAAEWPEERAVLADDVILDVLEQFCNVLPFLHGDRLDGAWWDHLLITSRDDVYARGGRSGGDGASTGGDDDRVAGGYGGDGGGGGGGVDRLDRLEATGAGDRGPRGARFLREGADLTLRTTPALAARDLHRAAHSLIVISPERIAKLQFFFVVTTTTASHPWLDHFPGGKNQAGRGDSYFRTVAHIPPWHAPPVI